MAFVTHLRSQDMRAEHFNALIDELDQGYDLILANAVLLHFDRQQFSAILKKICRSLKYGGKFAFTLKRGDGEEWSSAKLNSPRYYCYWQPEDLASPLSGAGFARWSIDSVTTDRKHADWILVIASR